MAQCYRHLQYDERCQIRVLHTRGVSISEIARQLGRDKATISRELRRNRGATGYFHQQAQRMAEQRRSAVSSRPRKLTPVIWGLVRALLLLQWSPEQIAGRLDRSGVVSVSFSWIYKQIHRDRARGGKLFVFLRQRGRKRRQQPAAGSAGRGLPPTLPSLTAPAPLLHFGCSCPSGPRPDSTHYQVWRPLGRPPSSSQAATAIAFLFCPGLATVLDLLAHRSLSSTTVIRSPSAPHLRLHFTVQ